MFGLLKKIWIQLTGALHDVVDNNSDVGRMARQGVRELEQQIGKAEDSIAAVDAELRLMRKDHQTALKDANKWDEVARTAANDGRREEALGAINNQVLAEERAQAYEKNANDLAPSLTVLNQQLAELRMQKQQRDTAATLLEARSKVAKAKTNAARTIGNVGQNPGVDFEALDRKVDRQEATAAALSDMASARAAVNPERHLADIRRRDSVAAKAAKLGLLTIEPASSGQIVGDKHE
ncbi:PspA/IM30 family protein [Janthinobacterium sp. NKUCC08_JDC]|uniref:PspA/IM30 family protein n=1 Tax=Janthinobacterium sp. NKUCC08_JDC TaxID=2842122 RepID=UPI001C5B6659|nr:PspA/IM30 family protein [Janthinobacterium sp. NKUCC08_JDC]MBW3499899.1 PspA/IM30 family protein [Janthinobacterium sp. NKUCC08_JDC]